MPRAMLSRLYVVDDKFPTSPCFGVNLNKKFDNFQLTNTPNAIYRVFRLSFDLTCMKEGRGNDPWEAPFRGRIMWAFAEVYPPTRPRVHAFVLLFSCNTGRSKLGGARGHPDVPRPAPECHPRAPGKNCDLPAFPSNQLRLSWICVISLLFLVPSLYCFDPSMLHAALFHSQNPLEYSGTALQSFPRFTSIIKGLRRGELTIITGPTGSGKTTILSQMSLDLARGGISTLWGSFEIKNTRLLQKMLQQFVGRPLKDISG